jgi:hypothetical protein
MQVWQVYGTKDRKFESLYIFRTLKKAEAFSKGLGREGEDILIKRKYLVSKGVIKRG